MKKALLTAAVGLSFFAGAFPAFAETASSTTEVNAALLTELNRGSQGDLVKLLQALLASDPTIYPEGLITGTFGPLTARAVARFQKKHGLEQAGRVGPKTLRALREDFASTTLATEDEDGDEDHDGHKGKRICIPPGHLIAPGWIKKNGNLMSLTLVASTTGTVASTTIPFCKTVLPKGIQDKMGTTTWRGDKGGKGHGTTTPPVATTTPDTTAPVLSDINISGSLASTTLTVNWATNENSTSKVYVSTTTPLVFLNSMKIENTSLVMSHHVGLGSLTASTTYYYVVESKDASNNTATSSEKSFLTSN